MNFLEKIQHKHKAHVMILKREEDSIPGPAGMLKKQKLTPNTSTGQKCGDPFVGSACKVTGAPCKFGSHIFRNVEQVFTFWDLHDHLPLFLTSSGFELATRGKVILCNESFLLLAWHCPATVMRLVFVLICCFCFSVYLFLAWHCLATMLRLVLHLILCSCFVFIFVIFQEMFLIFF